MPVKSSASSVIKWPDLEAVLHALNIWVKKYAQERRELLKAGYFGSYARGDWGVGSDLDLIMIVSGSNKPFSQRRLDWDTSRLPVPTDILVYTLEEWHKMLADDKRFIRMIKDEACWFFSR
jgi:uncharacterized protein